MEKHWQFFIKTLKKLGFSINFDIAVLHSHLKGLALLPAQQPLCVSQISEGSKSGHLRVKLYWVRWRWRWCQRRRFMTILNRFTVRTHCHNEGYSLLVIISQSIHAWKISLSISKIFKIILSILNSLHDFWSFSINSSLISSLILWKTDCYTSDLKEPSICRCFKDDIARRVRRPMTIDQ